MCDATDEIASKENLQKEFEDIRCASQRLLVENGARSSSVSSDEDRTGIKRKSEKLLNFDCGTDAHQLTMEDIYTQDKWQSTSSESCSPIAKPARNNQSLLGVGCNNSPKRFDNANELEHFSFNSTVPKVFDKLTALNECTTVNSLVNILLVVIQVNDCRDVQIKSGTNAGSFVAVSSILVADES